MSTDGPPPIPVDFSEDDCQMEDVSRAKREMRARMAKALGEMAAEERASASSRVCDHVRALPEYAGARSIAMYCALDDEVDLSDAIERALGAGRDVLVPVTDVERHEIRFVSVQDPTCDLAEGAYGILEPRRGLPLNEVSNLGMVLVPGRAFDSSGGRLGRGGGYYDAFLSQLKPFAAGGTAKLGVGFACQMVESVPTTLRDVSLDGVVTEDGVVWFGRGAS